MNDRVCPLSVQLHLTGQYIVKVGQYTQCKQNVRCFYWRNCILNRVSLNKNHEEISFEQKTYIAMFFYVRGGDINLDSLYAQGKLFENKLFN